MALFFSLSRTNLYDIEILQTLQQDFPEQPMILQDVSNAIQSLTLKKLAGRTPNQAMFEILHNNDDYEVFLLPDQQKRFAFLLVYPKAPLIMTKRYSELILLLSKILMIWQ